MAGLVLVIDDKERLGQVVEDALDGLDAGFEIVNEIPAAKRFLISQKPGIVISNVLLGENQAAGFEFCREMRDHTLFANLPVILVGESLDDDVIRAATESGAHGLVGWPVAASTLRKRLVHFLEDNSTQEAPVTNTPPPAPSAPSAVDASALNAAVIQEASLDDKLKKAQHLLAMVLHSLKTSNLLEVVELEDVASIVLQMTRTVCEAGDAAPQAAKSPAAANQQEAQADEQEIEVEVELDLDNVFGLKK